MNRGQIVVLHAVTSSLSLVLLRGQLSYLRDAGFHPAVLCSGDSDVELMQTREHLHVLTVPMEREISPLRDLISLIQLWRTLRELRPAICNAGTPKAGMLVGLAAWMNRVPCRVYTLRGLRLETATGLKRRILFISERIACGCAHRVLCVSPSLLQRAIELRLVPAKKAMVLAFGSSNGVDPSRFEPTPERLEEAKKIRSELGIENDQPVIGFIGRFTRDKGIPELLAAFQLVREKVPDAVLLLVGNYERGDSVPPETRTAIESEPNVVTVDFTPNVDLYYLLMDIFVLPTHREGFPNTVLEAQAAERPVVTTFATGAVDSVQKDVTGLLVPPGDVSALTAALVRLLMDNDLARGMGRTGRERVSREFRNEIIWEALASLYREMLKERGLSASDNAPREAATCLH
jgi:glycosyltransferase involved in cell wall biosynthesis